MNDPLYAPFWEGTRAGELRVPECQDCGSVLWPARPICPGCYGNNLSWRKTSTSGPVVSFIISRRAFHPAWSERTPYGIVLVEVEEGVRMLGNYRGEDLEEIEVGRELRARFDPQEGGATLVQWEPT